MKRVDAPQQTQRAGLDGWTIIGGTDGHTLMTLYNPFFLAAQTPSLLFVLPKHRHKTIPSFSPEGSSSKHYPMINTLLMDCHAIHQEGREERRISNPRVDETFGICFLLLLLNVKYSIGIEAHAFQSAQR